MKFFVFALLLLTGYLSVPAQAAQRATVKLLMHDLAGNALPARLIGGALSLTGEGGKHWAIVVQFDGDDQVYLCELHRDPNTGNKGSGGITWICERMTKEQVLNGKSGVHVYNFGKVDLTPEQLKTYCREIKFNGQDYNLILQNCQHWAKDLIGKLGLSTTWFNIKSFLEKTTGPGFFYSLFEGHKL
ncbi:PREDICTED: uncharacterized protein LOC108563933 [Nicrophorus vespilloides]|uniref:Uncharacterized protein LOC108563933 n=1 Tax=Nicrophorus vespilloides TaxID=110193 RepID=A0ABM1MUL0_NICVS|nr:PREDICTED: uncharacterized protein LOC108563933 [Nicrophorus vespilloides]